MSEHAEMATAPTSVDLQQILRDADIQPVIDSLEHRDRFLLRLVDGAAKIRGKDEPVQLYTIERAGEADANQNSSSGSV